MIYNNTYALATKNLMSYVSFILTSWAGKGMPPTIP